MLKLDASAREVVVGPREALRMRTLKLRDVNWLGDEALRGFRGGEARRFSRASDRAGRCSRRA